MNRESVMQEMSENSKTELEQSDQLSRRRFLAGCLLAGVAYATPTLFLVNEGQAASRPSRRRKPSRRSRPSRRGRPSRHSRPSRHGRPSRPNRPSRRSRPSRPNRPSRRSRPSRR
ncbi:MAG: twin-arginine translocation signal domain-containing protein [Desulfovibrio sp.]|nr:twin-arginine translocation signal domain-containing protein [Desulfovibrio sp.]